MASSEKPKRSRPLSSDLVRHVALRLKGIVGPGERLLLGLSGGADSMVLLDALARLAKRMRFELAALHVNHQLSANASRWARFCRAACRARGVPLRVVKVEVARGNSVERAAREARYAALGRARADHIVLAHNQDDQAETVLLQLLRAAGVRGLAAMAPVTSLGARAAHAAARARPPSARSRTLIRPLLDVPREAIERYARDRKIAWIEDESNTDTLYARNWLRHEVLPRIAERVPAYRATLARSARHCAEAATLLDELARIDASEAVNADAVSTDALSKLSHARAKNLLRFVIASRGWPLPDAQRLDEALRQALHARSDAMLAVNLGACELRRHGAALHLIPARAMKRDEGVVAWRGESRLVLPQLGGVLTMARRRGAGLSAAQLASQPVTIRMREGGERLEPHPARPRRTVKNLLQEAQIPAWRRARLPFIYCGDTLACVPGVAIDWRFQARRGEASIVPLWREQ